MAYTKIIPIDARLDRCIDYTQDEEKTSVSLSDAIDYALNRDKTEQTCYETAINCGRETVYQDMKATKKRWGKAGSGHVQGYHIIQSFVPGEITPDEAHAVGVEFAQRLFGERYEVIVSTHLNKAHLHNHVVVNSVSFMDGKMYRNNFRDYYGGDGVGIRGTSDAICREHTLSVIAPKGKGKQYSEWAAGKAGQPTIRGMIQADIDAAILRAVTFKTFWEELRRQGYEIKSGSNIKYTALRPPGGKRFIRLDSLGADYTEQAIKNRLTETRSGEAPPVKPSPPPASRWMEPGRRYHVRRGNLHRVRKFHGFRALYYKYLYLLGAVRKGRRLRKMPVSMRDEIIKFSRYQRQFLYLNKNRIETASQLSMQYDALQARLDVLTDQRRALYRAKRTGGGETVTAELQAITQEMRGLRRDLKLCTQIEGDIPRINSAVKLCKQDKQENRKKGTKTKPVYIEMSKTPGS